MLCAAGAPSHTRELPRLAPLRPTRYSRRSAIHPGTGTAVHPESRSGRPMRSSRCSSRLWSGARPSGTCRRTPQSRVLSSHRFECRPLGLNRRCRPRLRSRPSRCVQTLRRRVLRELAQRRQASQPGHRRLWRARLESRQSRLPRLLLVRPRRVRRPFPPRLLLVRPRRVRLLFPLRLLLVRPRRVWRLPPPRLRRLHEGRRLCPFRRPDLPRRRRAPAARPLPSRSDR